jgi:pilus assembly protein CpaC
MSAAMFGLHPARALACATATLLLWSAATPADAASRTTRATAAAGKATKAVKSRPRQARLAAAPAPTVAAPPVSAAEPTPETLQMQPGEQTVLRVSGRLLRVSLANDAVADVTPLHDAGGDSVRLRALAAGRSDLLLWTAGAAEPRRYTLEVRARSGELTASADAGGARLDGRATDLPSHDVARRELQRVGNGKDAPVDASVVAISSTVQVDVRVVEFSRTILNAAGLNLFTNRNGFSWGVFSPTTFGRANQGPPAGSSGAADAPRLTFSDNRSPVSDAFNLLFSRGGLVGHLSLLEGNGLARVLAEPSLVAMSGQNASFLAGGEIPIPVPQGLGSVAVEFKPFGIGLTVTPTILANDRIVLKVAPEASDLDYNNALQLNGTLVPAIITRRADTTVELGDNETFVIGGLVNSTTRSNVDKVPLLGDLPVLGSFFKNLRYTRDERELLILVTPRLVRPIAAHATPPALPGEREERAPSSVWGSHVSGAARGDIVPGFSR